MYHLEKMPNYETAWGVHVVASYPDPDHWVVRNCHFFLSNIDLTLLSAIFDPS